MDFRIARVLFQNLPIVFLRLVPLALLLRRIRIHFERRNGGWSRRSQLSRRPRREIGVSMGKNVQYLGITRELTAQHAQEVLQSVLLLERRSATYTVEADSLLQFLVSEVPSCLCEDGQGFCAVAAFCQCGGMFGRRRGYTDPCFGG